MTRIAARPLLERLTSIAIVASIAAAGCAKEEEDVYDDDAITVANAESRLREAVCDLFIRCETVRKEAECASVAHPLAFGSTFGTPAAIFASLRAGKVRMDASRAATCFDAIRRAPCESDALSTMISKPCEGAFTGLVVEGDACIATEACERGTWCVRAESTDQCGGVCNVVPSGECHRAGDCADDEACARGRCVPYEPPGIEGEPCGSLDACAPGLHCLVSGTSRTCIAPPAEGARCAVGKTCARADLTCVPEGTIATCRKARLEGDPCNITAECRGPLVCDAIKHECRPLPTTGSCLRDGSAWRCEPRESFCDETTNPRTCLALRRENEACRTSSECAAGPVAVEGWARPYLRNFECRDDGAGRACRRPVDAVCRP